MDETAFWRLMDGAADKFEPGSDEQYEWLSAQLAALPSDDILRFENMLNRAKAKSYTFPVLMANFIMQSYVSDDVFEDFRLWLISNGKARFNAALDDPDSIADWCNMQDPAEEIAGEGLAYVAEQAYRKKAGNEHFTDHVELTPDPEIEENWPEKKEGFAEVMPKLFRKFWNQETVNEIHRQTPG